MLCWTKHGKLCTSKQPWIITVSFWRSENYTRFHWSIESSCRQGLEVLRDYSCPMQLLETTSFFVWWPFHLQSQQQCHSGFYFNHIPSSIFLPSSYTTRTFYYSTVNGELINHWKPCHRLLEAEKPTVRMLVKIAVCQEWLCHCQNGRCCFTSRRD